MLLSYIIIALRNHRKNKLIAAIELIGLAIGMSVGLILITVIKGQVEYDNFHPFTDRTFRIITDVRHYGSDVNFPASMAFTDAGFFRLFGSVSGYFLANLLTREFTYRVSIGHGLKSITLTFKSGF